MKNFIQKIKENYGLVIAVLIVGLLLGWIISPSGDKPATTDTEIHEGHNHESEAEIWTCSMHPQIRMDHPGKCPICAMDLIPLSSMKSTGDEVNPNEIAMTESAAKLAEIQTMVVTKGSPEKTMYLQGKVHADERNIAELTARFGGRIEKLFVNFTGQHVQKGEKLATIYSPGLVAAQRELLEAKTLKESRPSLYNATKAKLKLWDLSDGQIASIEEKGEPQLYFDILSPIAGTVMMRHVALGDYIKEGSALFQIIDLTRVWVMFDAYESDLPWIKTGDQVSFTVQAIPGKNYKGKVGYIDPFINSATRVANIRVEIANPKLELKPEMFVNGTIRSEIAGNSNDLLIPKSAVLWTGKRSVAYVKVPERENPTFLYRQIELGPEAGNFYVITDGLTAGEEIAVNGVFKIDAAAQLQGLPSMMNPEGGATTSGHNHNGMDMGTTGTMNTNVMEQSEISVRFKAQLQNVYDAYLKMKNAFVESDSKQVNSTALGVKSTLKKIDMELLKGDAHMAWMKQLNTMNSSIEKIIKQTDIDEQRKEFANFNQAFYASLKAFGLNGETAYYQYCPMANSDQGAYWLSETKEIRNPYFGEEMLGCGETRETLE